MNRWTATWGMLLVVAGCGRGDAPLTVAPVAGVVRYNGIPVRDAYVKFSQKGSPIIAGGFTDDTGRFELTSYETGDGAPVGENAVTIAVASAPAAGTDESPTEADAEAITDPAERKKEVAEAARRRKTARAGSTSQSGQPRSRIPRKYASEETSNLSFVVEAGIENVCEFDLTD